MNTLMNIRKGKYTYSERNRLTKKDLQLLFKTDLRCEVEEDIGGIIPNKLWEAMFNKAWYDYLANSADIDFDKLPEGTKKQEEIDRYSAVVYEIYELKDIFIACLKEHEKRIGNAVDFLIETITIKFLPTRYADKAWCESIEKSIVSCLESRGAGMGEFEITSSLTGNKYRVKIG